MWFAIVGKRTLHGTTARTRSPAVNPVAAEEERLVAVEAERVDELGAHRRVVVPLDPALVGDLAAAGRVERRLAELREERAVAEILERAELREHVDLRVADELRCEPGVAREVGRALREPALARPARDLLVPLHLGPVAVDVDLLAALAGELDGQLDREAVRRGEPECVLARRCRCRPAPRTRACRGRSSRGTAPPRRERRARSRRRSRRPPGTTGRPARRRPAGSWWTAGRPIRRAWTTERRISRRSTYPRPSFDGVMPSATRNVIPRPWSERTRCAFVASGEAP